MREPHDAGEERPGHDRMRDEHGRCGSAVPVGTAPPKIWRRDAQEQGDGRRQHEEGRGHHRQQQVLDHVDREEGRVEGLDGRGQSDDDGPQAGEPGPEAPERHRRGGMTPVHDGPRPPIREGRHDDRHARRSGRTSSPGGACRAWAQHGLGRAPRRSPGRQGGDDQQRCAEGQRTCGDRDGGTPGASRDPTAKPGNDALQCASGRYHMPVPNGEKLQTRGSVLAEFRPQATSRVASQSSRRSRWPPWSWWHAEHRPTTTRRAMTPFRTSSVAAGFPTRS